MRYSELSRSLTAGDTHTVYRWVTDLLDSLARGSVRLPAVRHPLGFVCYPVERDGPDGVCLHVWDRPAAESPGHELTTSEVHAHSWDLLSLVLYGEVRNTVFDALPARATATSDARRLCEVHSGGDGDRIHATNRLVHLATRHSDLHRTGSVYTLPAGVFHTSLVHGLAATVALGHGVEEAVDLSVAPVQTPTHDVRRTACSTAEAEQTARQAFAMLRGGRHED